MKKAMIVLACLAGVIMVQGLALAAAAKEQSRKSIVLLMRENGCNHKSASWTSESVTVDENKKTTNSSGKVWLSGDKYRMETKDQQGKKMIMLDDGKDLYMISVDEKKAYTGEALDSMFGGVLASDMVSESVRQRKTAKKLGSETVEGKPCSIYQYKMKVKMMGNVTESDVKEWVWTAEGFPIKSVVKTPKHKMKIAFMSMDVPASETTSLVKDLELDKAVDDAMFQVPSGYKVERMDAMPGAMGGEAEGGAKPSKSGKSGGSEGSDEEGSANQPPVDVNKMLKGLF